MSAPLHRPGEVGSAPKFCTRSTSDFLGREFDKEPLVGLESPLDPKYNSLVNPCSQTHRQFQLAMIYGHLSNGQYGWQTRYCFSPHRTRCYQEPDWPSRLKGSVTRIWRPRASAALSTASVTSTMYPLPPTRCGNSSDPSRLIFACTGLVMCTCAMIAHIDDETKPVSTMCFRAQLTGGCARAHGAVHRRSYRRSRLSRPMGRLRIILGCC
jgi:hypothetical protein